MMGYRLKLALEGAEVPVERMGVSLAAARDRRPEKWL
jgi:hypothetical protein